MKTLISSEFNIDTVCVEVKYNDGSMIFIDCTAVENELDAFISDNRIRIIVA